MDLKNAFHPQISQMSADENLVLQICAHLRNLRIDLRFFA